MVTSRFIPPHAVDRPELRRELDVALVRPLTVMVAGAGAGKSVLLTQWTDSHPEAPIVWIEVGDGDEDRGHFLIHLLNGLEAVSPGIAQLASTETLSRLGINASIIAAIVDRLVDAGELVVIFDDVHHLSSSMVADVARLVDALPPNAHVIMSSRVDLHVVGYRLRMRDDVHEIRQAQLAFDMEQSAELLRRVTRVELDEASVAALVERTEGWVAGLLLAAVTIRRHPDPAAFIAEFRGSNRLVADYLSEEILATLSDDDRREMLELSALDRVSLPLVAELAAFAASPEFLLRLERDSQFLIPLDDHQEWFRLHHLFRDMLRVRLRVEYPGTEWRILTRAAAWHLHRGETGTAIEYFLRANEWDRAIDVILSSGSGVFERGEMATVLRWITDIPESVRAENIDLLLMHGILAGMAGDAATAEDLLRDAADHVAATPGQVASAHSFLAAQVQWRPRPQSSIDCAERALAALDALGDGPTPDILQLTDPGSLESVALVSGGRAHFLAGQLTEARDWLERGLASEGALYSVWRVHTLGSLALLEAWGGQTLKAAELAAEALSVAESTGTFAHPATADAFLANALSAVERCDFGRAEHELRQAKGRVAVNQRTQLAWVAYAIDAQLRSAQGEELTDSPPPGTPPPVVSDLLSAVRARTLRLNGAPEAAWHLLAERSSRSSEMLFELCSADLALGRTDEAREVLDLMGRLPDAERPLPKVRNLLLATSLSATLGRNARTDSLLVEALRIAEEYGLIAVFAEAGPEITSRIAALGIPSLPGVAATVLSKASAVARVPMDNGLTEPLTDRELELLVLFPTRFTNTELADRFFVSVNTIKSHMAHIYRKLEVSTRSGAIERATQLGLIK